MLVTHSRKPAAVMVAAVIWLAGLTACQLARHDAAPDPIVAPGQIVFVCEHGSVKSLIAASLFERAAAERGLDVHAVSRGVSPDERVPAKIVAALGGEKFERREFSTAGADRRRSGRRRARRRDRRRPVDARRRHARSDSILERCARCQCRLPSCARGPAAPRRRLAGRDAKYPEQMMRRLVRNLGEAASVYALHFLCPNSAAG